MGFFYIHKILLYVKVKLTETYTDMNHIVIQRQHIKVRPISFVGSLILSIKYSHGFRVR